MIRYTKETESFTFKSKDPALYNKSPQILDSYDYLFMLMGLITGVTFRLSFEVTNIKGHFLTKSVCRLCAPDIMEAILMGIFITHGGNGKFINGSMVDRPATS